MRAGLDVLPLNLDSPFFRAVLNDRWTRVWLYWRSGDYYAAAEKADVEERVAAIVRV